MTKHLNKAIMLLLIATFFLAQCKKEVSPAAPDLPLSANEIIQQYFTFSLDALPNYASQTLSTHYDANILATDNAPDNNPVTNAGALLGRVLFYDKNLSRNNTIACASCHDQSKGFSDDKILSEGFLGGLTGKHSMRLANTNFYIGERMFWDKRAINLEDQTTRPIQDMTEMGFDAASGGIDSLIRKMQKLNYYPVLFETAFGTQDITEQRMKMALAQFIRSMVSANSKFDDGFASVFNTAVPNANVGAPFPNFSQQENQGKALFLAPPPQGGAGCAGCHAPPTFALAANSLNNGLDAGETVIFKSSSLKNVDAAIHYMHDGRFTTLEEVIEHYNSGIQNGPTLDNRLRTPNGQALRLNLSQAQKDALVAFLKTLTDQTIMTDPKFADPFK